MPCYKTAPKGLWSKTMLNICVDFVFEIWSKNSFLSTYIVFHMCCSKIVTFGNIILKFEGILSTHEVSHCWAVCLDDETLIEICIFECTAISHTHFRSCKINRFIVTRLLTFGGVPFPFNSTSYKLCCTATAGDTPVNPLSTTWLTSARIGVSTSHGCYNRTNMFNGTHNFISIISFNKFDKFKFLSSK